MKKTLIVFGLNLLTLSACTRSLPDTLAGRDTIETYLENLKTGASKTPAQQHIYDDFARAAQNCVYKVNNVVEDQKTEYHGMNGHACILEGYMVDSEDVMTAQLHYIHQDYTGVDQKNNFTRDIFSVTLPHKDLSGHDVVETLIHVTETVPSQNKKRTYFEIVQN